LQRIKSNILLTRKYTFDIILFTNENFAFIKATLDAQLALLTASHLV